MATTGTSTDARTCPHCEQQIASDNEACPACGTLFVSAACENHPDREAKGSCVICGRRLCGDCDIEAGSHHACRDHAEIPVFEGWAQLYTTANEVEAELIRENMEAEGIDAEVLSQHDRALAFSLGDFSRIRVLVPAFAYLEAQPILSRHMDASGEVSFACPTCGEKYEPGDTECRACGAALPRALA